MPNQTPIPISKTAKKGSAKVSGKSPASVFMSNAGTPSPPPPSTSIPVSNPNPNKRKALPSNHSARPKKQVKIAPSPVVIFPTPVNPPSTGEKSETPVQSSCFPCKLRIRPGAPNASLNIPSSTTPTPLVTGNAFQPSKAVEIDDASGNLAAFAALACEVAEADSRAQGMQTTPTPIPTPEPPSAMDINPEVTLRQEPPLKKCKHSVAEQSLSTIAAVCKVAAEEESEAERFVEEVGGRLMGDGMDIEKRVQEGMKNGGCRRVMEEVLKEFELLKKRVAREVGGALWELEKIRRKANQGGGSAGSATGGDAEGDELEGGDAETGEADGKSESIKKRKGKEGGKKRKRDNWSITENEDFLRLVWKHEGMEEMALRRMLARHFGPRRSHEQCANHLRILRAQKRVPVAAGEAIVYPQRKKADEAGASSAGGSGDGINSGAGSSGAGASGAGASGAGGSGAGGSGAGGSRAEGLGAGGSLAMGSGARDSAGNV